MSRWRLLFIFAIAGCSEVESRLLFNSDELRVRLFDISVKEIQGEAAIAGTLEITSKKSPVSFDTRCLEIQMGDIVSDNVYVDSVASVLSVFQIKQDEPVTVDVYWVFSTPVSSIDMSNAVTLTTASKNRLSNEECVNEQI